jgi:hypothetical protein
MRAVCAICGVRAPTVRAVCAPCDAADCRRCARLGYCDCPDIGTDARSRPRERLLNPVSAPAVLLAIPDASAR